MSRSRHARSSARIAEELDYRLEAANQADFAERYRDHPFIHVPEVIGELCTGRVLTQELCMGRSWSEALGAEQELRDQWAEAIWRFVYGSHRRFGTDQRRSPSRQLRLPRRRQRELPGLRLRQALPPRPGRACALAILRECLRGDVLGTWRACVEGGFWSSSDPVTPEEVFAWWHEPFRYLWDEQPFTITPEYAASWIERRFSPTGPSANALRYITLPPDCTGVDPDRDGAGVRDRACCAPANSLGRHSSRGLENAAPLTEMGKLDHAFFAEREVASHA